MSTCCKPFYALIFLAFLCAAPSFLPGQTAAPAHKGPKLCVAQTANSSNKPVFADDVKESLFQAMLKAGLNADDSPTATMLANKLDMTYKNELVAKRLHCDYVLLSEIAAGASPSDKAAPIRADQLRLDFALFKRHASKAVMEGAEDAPATAKLTDGFLEIAPKVAARIAAAIPAK